MYVHVCLWCVCVYVCAEVCLQCYFVLLKMSTDGDTSLGNFARFENCTFRENVVPEFGAAIGIYSLYHFRFRELAKSIEIVDW